MSGDSTNECTRYLFKGSRGGAILKLPAPLETLPVTPRLPLMVTLPLNVVGQPVLPLELTGGMLNQRLPSPGSAWTILLLAVTLLDPTHMASPLMPAMVRLMKLFSMSSLEVEQHPPITN